MRTFGFLLIHLFSSLLLRLLNLLPVPHAPFDAAPNPDHPSLMFPDRFVHTFTKGAPDMANTFAQQHSLSKLAQSLKTFWARSPGPTQEEVFEWDQCMLSLLEIASSVSAMTGERDVLVDLDAEVYSGVTGVRRKPPLLIELSPSVSVWLCSSRHEDMHRLLPRV